MKFTSITWKKAIAIGRDRAMERKQRQTDARNKYMNILNDPAAAALADRLRFIIKKDRECYDDIKRLLGDEYPSDFLEFEAENKRVLAAYEEAAKAVSTKPGDWIIEELRIEIARSLFGNPTTKILELPESVKKAVFEGADRIISIIAKHAPAQPKREVSARELLRWLDEYGYSVKTMHEHLAKCEAERARADMETSNDH